MTLLCCVDLQCSEARWKMSLSGRNTVVISLANCESLLILLCFVKHFTVSVVDITCPQI